MEIVIEIGDTVQARKSGASGGVAVMEFIVEDIIGTVYVGSPLGDIDTEDGWSLEVVQKGDPGLPTTISDLAVLTTTERNQATRVIGPIAGVWQTPSGVRVDPEDVLAWEPWTEPQADEPMLYLNEE